MASLASLLKPPPDIEPVPPEEMMGTYRYWRMRQLYATFTGYTVYYFVRQNLPVAIPLLQAALGFSKAQVGAIQSIQAVVYGVSKFLNGVLADRSNPRYFLAAGLMASAILNVLFGVSSSLYLMAFLWALNGWVQGMGFPPCARVLSHWFSPKERGRFWAIWNTSHQVGGAVILVAAGYLAEHYGWRSCFFAPALVAAAVAFFVMDRVHDTPGSLGLPPVETYTGEGDATRPQEALSAAAFKRFLARFVFGNPVVWLICTGNFFVYLIRYGFVTWAPSYLQQVKHVSPAASGGMVGGFEIAGLFGSVLAGYLTDRFFRGKRAPVCVAYLLGTAACIACFWKMPPGFPWYDSITLWMVGFLVYGPQFLVGVMTADVVTRQGAATAIGLTGFFGYISQVLSGWGLGWLVDTWGWNGYFEVLIACALLGAVPFMLCWRVGPTPEEDVRKHLEAAPDSVGQGAA